MRISTKGRYALRLMLDLAEHQGDGCVSLKDVAQRQDISKKYLEQIVPTLSRAGFLLTNRGYQGGYQQGYDQGYSQNGWQQGDFGFGFDPFGFGFGFGGKAGQGAGERHRNRGRRAV